MSRSRKRKPIPPGYWPCACVKRDRDGNLKGVKMQPPQRMRCLVCGCQKPDETPHTEQRT